MLFRTLPDREIVDFRTSEETMKRVLLIVAYDGTKYAGWQIQPNAITIEEVLNRHLSQLLNEEIKVTGASRTDSGVHALGNIAVFCTKARIPADKISFALNQRLPEDIRIQASREVAMEFHPRHCQCKKTYEYLIYNHTFPMPCYRFNSHFVHAKLDLGKMQEAAGYLIGTHDFKSFCSVHTQVQDTTRTIHDILITKVNNMISIRISGNGFLYNMVRIIVGTLFLVGQNQMEPEVVQTILEKKDRSAAGPTAPAKGLTLVQIEYPQEIE